MMTTQRSYQGKRTEHGAQVTVTQATVPEDNARTDQTDPSGQTERDLPLRLDLWNHSPTGFEWGYGGSGPAQLALALLADALGDDKKAVALHQAFKWQVVARLPARENWTLTDEEVRTIAARVEAEQQAARQARPSRGDGDEVA
jgi:hypothetical protein